MDPVRIPVPGPLGADHVNCYLLPGEPCTLIDTGPHRGAWDALVDGLAEEGVSPADVDRVLLTHHHSDHFGNAHRLRDAGATVMSHRDAAPIVESYPAHRERSDAFFSTYFTSHGMPADVADGLVASTLPDADCSVQVDRRLAPGDTVTVPGGILELVDAPGHASGNAVFMGDGTAFTGDTVLQDITPNPTLQLPRDGEEPPASLAIYLDTLSRLKTVLPDQGYGGHGPPIPDVPGRIREIEEHHADRLETVHGLLDGPTTAFTVMNELFPDLSEPQYYFGMSESIGHLVLLEMDGRVSRTERDGTVYFSRS